MRSYIYTALLAFAAFTSQLGVTSAHRFGGSVRAGIIRDTLENRQADGEGGLDLAGAAANLVTGAGDDLGGVGVGGNGPPDPDAGLPLIGGLPLAEGLLDDLPSDGGLNGLINGPST